MPFLKFYFCESVINKVLRMASLHMVFFKCGNGPFFSIVFFVVFFFEEFVLRNLSLLSVGDTLLACEQAL